MFEAVKEAIASALGSAMDCNRVWSAWAHGTMGESDFSLIADDDDRLHEITAAAIEAMRPHHPPLLIRREAALVGETLDPDSLEQGEPE